ncbi:UDP-N-acetylmuramoyl-L-alanyl-D-glutamate--2,6-diaminopimelate ligase [Texcoconibacillus texcoconensis]|uniref:UDP-N-acetylmuramoyl-L-alanyl-D-glutamate--2,6-diaminopimelate ligase n=1 Tax=Texcoconibacillus texcoconensis TaxID=1095777 RepID=A0A840QLD9_9BACI|nr:UDP-N-acetylmuramoyl-L-alanyl-D-glutamate--2,6-diaminopimelate ligase [Texcoconibacillus texcoconensis]MBB5172177.1 UDP-N-acetylmuramoyl-L-alanyl-D-glutamate--2,6-diaminopimelate ligase [Texcoconibacillus texcoconensis]
MFTLQQLIDSIPFYSMSTEEDPVVHHLEMDSRHVTLGSLFFCVPGYTVDGHDFAEEAEKNGAVAIIAERPVSVDIPVVIVKDVNRAMALIANKYYDHPTSKFQLIGVTGTNGKTTTTHFIEQILQYEGKGTGLIGTLYVKMNGETEDVVNTTPAALPLQQTFDRMVDNNVNAAVMEVSSHALSLGRVWGCDYDIAVFTNLTQDHLDYHKTMDHYRFSKSLLFSQLGNAYHRSPKYAVINRDDEAAPFFEEASAAPVITYGLENEADLQAVNVEATPKGTTFQLKTPRTTLPFSLNLLGRFNVYNALASIAACYAAGIDLERIRDAMHSVAGVPGRFERVDVDADYSVIVDYAHTPDSLENVLQTATEVCQGSLTVVVGCGGDRDRTKRPVMAEVACRYADRSIFTSDNPRSEKPELILEDMEAGVPKEDYETIVDRKEAINKAVDQAQAGDVIVIAGKGHETYQEVGGQRLDFDDRLVAKQAMKGRA